MADLARPASAEIGLGLRRRLTREKLCGSGRRDPEHGSKGQRDRHTPKERPGQATACKFGGAYLPVGRFKIAELIKVATAMHSHSQQSIGVARDTERNSNRRLGSSPDLNGEFVELTGRNCNPKALSRTLCVPKTLSEMMI